MTKKIYYWSPFTSPVATVQSVINSIISLQRFGKGKFEPYIINAVGEWNTLKKNLDEKIEFVDLSSNNALFERDISKYGFLKSRFYYWYIFIKSFIPRLKILKKNPPEYLIIHLITSLPIILFLLFNFKTKLILRISGLPKLNFIRKILWKVGVKKIDKISCPTQATYDHMSSYSFLKNKLFLLRDPIIDVKKYLKKKNEKEIINDSVKNFISSGNYFLLIGRLTKQKNFLFLLNCLREISLKNKNLNFLIIGDGEEKKKLKQFVKNYNLEKCVKFLDYTNNVFYYMSKSKAFILTSLWEDPGFVLIEAGLSNCSIISSDCPNGPMEIVGEKGGFIFSSNNKSSFLKTLDDFLKSSSMEKHNKKVIVKKKVKEFTIFRHYLKLKDILN